MINLLAKKPSALRTGVLSSYSNNTKETVFHAAIYKISKGFLCCLLRLLATMQKRHLKHRIPLIKKQRSFLIVNSARAVCDQ
jgi:hypothetical protein